MVRRKSRYPKNPEKIGDLSGYGSADAEEIFYLIVELGYCISQIPKVLKLGFDMFKKKPDK